MDIPEIQAVLTELATLLRAAGKESWARGLERARALFNENPVAAKSDVLCMFGGAGSLNDVVLYRDGQPLIAENNALHASLSRLYALLH